ncbi:MAG: RecX family transcriptional regulator [Alphaproteobacteria bacterium]|nr:RecX family transcriptional regulator [Alphaproteobacteria bacterium]
MKRKSRRYAIPTSERLAKVALAYLARYAASEAALRRVLENRLRRAAMHDTAFASDHVAQKKLRETITNIIERHTKNGVLNDKAFTETKLNSLRRAGRSRRAIEQKLAQAGISKNIVRTAFEGEESEEVELTAARKLARRKKLGAFRSGKTAPDQRRKDLAVLARAGFSLAIARMALDTASETTV